MTRALILGTLAGQVDAIRCLQHRGVEVHACGHVESGPGVEAADAFHLVDITDADAVAGLARDLEVKFVYSVGSDIAMPTVSEVSEKLDLPHFHSSQLTDILRRKERLRAHLDTHHMSPVEFTAATSVDDIGDWSRFPAIVKPVDAQGQRGITVVHDDGALREAFEVASAEAFSGAVIIEELLIGPEVSVHVMVVQGKVVFYLPSDRHVWDGPLVGIPRAHSVPSRHLATAQDHEAMWELVQGVVSSLEVSDGPLYFQTILTDQGPRIVEIASRLDGCHLWRLIKESSGFDLLDAVLGRLLGDPWPDVPVRPDVEPMALEFFLGPPEMTVTPDNESDLTHPDARFVEFQVDEQGHPRRTNEVVARAGYQVFGES